MPVNMKNIIADAFAKMAKKKGIDKITVKALIDECNISRQTFYYHFRDIMEVIEWSIEESVKRMLARSLEIESPEDAVELLIVSTLEQRTLICRLMDSQKRGQIEKLFVQATRMYLQELIRNRGGEVALNYSDMETVLDFWSFGLCGMLFKCCEAGEVDAKSVAAQICRLLPEKRGGEIKRSAAL
ncbi:MAG TPA: TetR family transcriptional regulator [Candidatus Blautia excrementipullorum]|nr:TetR family transcriptional regulator [Candidatus Blautia excrementipullorum]